MASSTASDPMLKPEQNFEDFVLRWAATGHVGLQWDSDTPLWTVRVLEVFRQMGVKSGCVVYPETSPTGKTEREEYLADLVWSREDPKSYFGLDLALESEWGGYDEVLEDFYKLVDIKAGLKVMVCATVRSPKKDLPALLAQAVRDVRLKMAGEAYLVILFRPLGIGSGSGYDIEGYEIDNSGNHRQLSRHAVSATPSSR